MEIALPFDFAVVCVPRLQQNAQFEPCEVQRVKFGSTTTTKRAGESTVLFCWTSGFKGDDSFPRRRSLRSGAGNVAEIRGGKSFLQLTCMTDYVFNASGEECEPE